MRIKVLVVLWTLLVIGSVSMASSATNPFSVDAQVGLLFDFDSDQVLFSQQGGEPWVPASLVKVMTMYVALDRIAEGTIALDDTTVISEAAWRMSGSQMFLEAGEKVDIESLLFGVAVVSGNDACVAIAEAMAGTEQLFVRWMNDKAALLNLDLHFVDVHGLSEDNRITAKDFALLAHNYITDHPDALQYHQQRSFGYQPRSRTQPIFQNNRNGLLWRFEGADGLKTGFLSKSGYNLVATAKQDDRRLIAVVLGADSERKREDEVTKLLNFGFRSFETVKITQLLPEEQTRVYKGRERTVPFVPENLLVTFPRGTRAALQIDTVLELVEAPVEVGDPVGEVVVSHDDIVLRRTPLVAAEAIARGNIFRVVFDSLIIFFSNLIQLP